VDELTIIPINPAISAKTPMDPNVAAVVLTYNRLHLLKECIAALKGQTMPPRTIVVIDNGSGEDTKEWLAQQTGITLITLKENVGPAAGIKLGLKTAYEHGYQWMWVMDDDGLPHTMALEKMLTAKPGFVGAINSIVLDKDDKKTLAFKLHNYKTLDDITTSFVEDEIMPWNGTLFHREIIQKVGYPREELFLWGEEMEYYFRIKSIGGFPMFSVRDSWHFHPRNKGFFYRDVWDVKTNDRAYYFVRNKYPVYLSRHKRNKFKAFLHYLLFNTGMLYYILFYQKGNKGKKMKLVWAAAKDALSADFTKKPADVQVILKKL